MNEGLHTHNLHTGYSEAKVVSDLNLTIPVGKITALVGANGSGKTTILKTMARIMKPESGSVLLDGHSIHDQSTKQVARQLAILPQNPTAPDGLTVSDLVGYGRFPHKHGFGNLTADDHAVMQWAMVVTGMTEFFDRPVDHLSGGQRQRAWIAMALAQQTKVLLLDEPTTFLDMAHQLEVLHLLRKLNSEQGSTIVMVVHDLNHAARYADHIVAIKDGRVVSEGSPAQVVTAAMLREVFAVEADILADPRTGLPLCLPYQLSLS